MCPTAQAGAGEAAGSTASPGGRNSVLWDTAQPDVPPCLTDTVACLLEVLQWLDRPQARLDALRAQDTQGWSALHYAAKSGVFGHLPWHLLGTEMEHVPVNLRTAAGATMLQLAVWNARATSVNMMLGDWSDDVRERIRNPWVSRLKFNDPGCLATGKYGEIDLALMRNHTNCARILVRRGVTGALP